MKILLKILAPIIALVILGLVFREPIKTKVIPFITGFVAQINTKANPCKKPITYAIGTFDTKFGISEKYFLGALADAEAIWEKPLGKELFTYASDNGVLKVNLVYDYRQATTSKLSGLNSDVKSDQASYDALEAKYNLLKSQYESVKSKYEAHVRDFDAKNDAYEKDVEYWNSRGGAPKDEYQKLESTRLALRAEATELKNTQNQLNVMVDQVNGLVVELNQMADTLNLKVHKYNTVGASRGESFEEGVYSSTAGKQEIDIYEFSSREKLVRVLAHELGHALGLEHVDDSRAIMYKLNQGSTQALSGADLDAIQAKCGMK